MLFINGVLEMTALGRCDLIIEAVYEDLGLKCSVFRRIDEIAKPGAILATNTSDSTSTKSRFRLAGLKP